MLTDYKLSLISENGGETSLRMVVYEGEKKEVTRFDPELKQENTAIEYARFKILSTKDLKFKKSLSYEEIKNTCDSILAGDKIRTPIFEQSVFDAAKVVLIQNPL